MDYALQARFIGPMADKVEGFLIVERHRIAVRAAGVLRAGKVHKADDDQFGIDWSGLADDLEPDLKAAYLAGASKAARDFAIELVFEQINEYAEGWAKDNAARLVTQISETTRDAIREMIEEAFTEGLSPGELANRIEDSFQFSRARSELIARTEVGNAQGQGTLDRWIEDEVVEGKRWILGSEHGPPDMCDTNAGAGVIPLKASFPSGDMAPLAHPQCACDAVAEDLPAEKG